VPNANVMDDLEARIARLSDDEKRLFAVICRSYLAAVMPDFEYRQTVVSMKVPVAGGESGRPSKPVEFRAVGRIPVVLGWKAAFGAAENDQGRDKEAEAEQTLPPLADGQIATLMRPKVQAKKTQPPPRYSEGTLVDAMQNAWRFVADGALRERLKEAKGIGTPATRAEVIKGLKRQGFLAAQGKLVVPTPAGLQLFEVLRGAAPPLVDPGTTAVWEMRLDDVVTGKADYRAVIDEICDEASRLIGVLRRHNGATVEISKAEGGSATTRDRRGRSTRRGEGEHEGASAGGQYRRPRRAKAAQGRSEARDQNGASSRSTRARGSRNGNAGPSGSAPPPSAPTGKAPTEKMVAFAKRLAQDKKAALPPGYDTDFRVCRAFLDQHAR